MHDEWMTRLSEYADGELAADEQRTLEAHLVDCEKCSEVLEDLRAVASRAASLEDRDPAVDLWPGIASRIRAVHSDEHEAVASLETRRWVRRRISFTVPQLAAAAVVAVLVGAGAVGLGRFAGTSPDRMSTVSVPVGLGTPVAEAVAGPAYDAVVTELEFVLEHYRDELDSATVRVLEASLSTIDGAIREARAALASDPVNAYLNTHLAATMRRKLTLLNRAVTLAMAAS